MTFIRHCPRCQSDYEPHISQCGDCGGSLEERVEGMEVSAPAAPALPPDTLPPGDYETFYFSRENADLDPLAERLTGRGIPFRIEPISVGPACGNRAPTRYELRVRDLDREAAGEELCRVMGEGIEPEDALSLDRSFDPASGYRQCPACSKELVPGTAECPECGLTLLDPEGEE